MIRHYPYGPAAAHVLGYVAAVSEKELTGDPLLELPDFRIGKSGIEKSQDLRLRGIAGTSEVEVNAYGRVVREIAHHPGQPGEDVVLGLDQAMQDFVEQALRRRAQRLLRRARRGHRRRAGAGVEPGLRSDAVLDRAHPGGLAGAVDRPAQPADRQGDRRRLPARFDIQADGGAGRARSRGHHPRHPGQLPRIFRARQRHLPLLEAGRPRHAADARRDQAILRCLLLRDVARRARHRPHRRDGAPLRLRRHAWSRHSGRTRRADPDPRLAAGDDRHDLADGRDPDRRHRPGLGPGDAAADGDDGRPAGHRPRRRAASGAPRRPVAARRRPAAARLRRRSASTRAIWRSCSTA